MGSGSGPGAQHNASGFGVEQQFGGGGGHGGAPPGFEGMASPYVQSAVPKREDGGSAHLALVTVVLRIASLVLAIISVGIIGAAKETNEYEDSDYNEVTVHWKALNSRESKYLLSIGAIVALYELVVVIVACITQGQASDSTFAGSLVTFVVDQVLAYLMFSSATAAVNEIIRYRYGHPSDAAYGDSRICKLSEWKTYCVKHEAGAAMGFVAFGALALVALLSGYRFSRHLS